MDLMTLAMLKKHFKTFGFKGDYVIDTTYNVNEVVRYNNNLYIARKQTVEIPTIETDWHLFLVGGDSETANLIGDLNELDTENKANLVEAINEVKRIGDNVKVNVVDALSSVDDSLPINYTSTWSDIVTSISDIETGIDTSDATATSAQILSGQTAYVNGQKLVGTMVNRGAVNQSLAVNSTYTIPQGYHDGNGKVTQSLTTKGAATITPGTTNQTIPADVFLTGVQTILGDADLIPANIKSGVDIFGVVGTLATGKRSQTGSGTSDGNGKFTIASLPFTPKTVRITFTSGYTTSHLIANKDANSSYCFLIDSSTDYCYAYPCIFSSNGFAVTISGSSYYYKSFTWEVNE